MDIDTPVIVAVVVVVASILFAVSWALQAHLRTVLPPCVHLSVDPRRQPKTHITYPLVQVVLYAFQAEDRGGDRPMGERL